MPPRLRNPFLLLVLTTAPLLAKPPQPQDAPLVLTRTEAAQYRKTLALPTVKVIRKFFTQYHSKKRQEVIESAICTDLQARPETHTRGRFLVAYIQGNLFGGEWVTVIFEAEPHALLCVWVKAGEVFAVANSTLPQEEQDSMVRRALPYLKNPKFTL